MKRSSKSKPAVSHHDTAMPATGTKVTNLSKELEKLQSHDHLCLIYESKKEWRDAIIPFLVIGLKQEEKCMYVVDTTTVDEIRTFLNEEGIDVTAVENSGQLVILSETETYTRNGSFDPDSIIALLIAETNQAITEGYKALRVTGEMTWVLQGYPGSEKLLEYEAKLNRDLFPEYPCLAICQYDRRKFDPEIIKGVVMTHPILIRGDKVYKNFYYVPPEAFLNEKRAAMEAQHWLNNIEQEQQMWQELVESRQRYLDLVENLHSGVAVYRTIDNGNDFIIIDFNQAAEMMDKINRKEIIGKSIFTAYPGIEEFGLLEVLQRVWHTGISERYPGKLYEDDRISGWRDTYVYKLLNSDIATIYEDITLQKNAEEKVRSSEIRYRRLFETAQDAILILDGDTGTIIDANPFIKDLLGYTMEELLGKNLWEIGASKDSLASQLSYRQLYRTGYVRYEHLPLISRNGTQIDVEVVANAYMVDETKVIQCNIRDVTERNKIETSLKESEARYRTLFESASEGIAISKIETKTFNYVNPAMCTMLGYTNEELITMHVTDIHPETSSMQIQAEFESQVNGDTTLASNIPCLKKDGTVIFVDINTAVTNIDGMACNIGFFTDISERKAVEEEQEKSARLESVGILAGGIAHDFNNILTGILGNIGLASISLSSGNIADADARLKDAERASSQARNLTQQLLTFAKGGAPVKNRVDCDQLIRESTGFALRGSNIKPEFTITKNLWAVRADEGQLNQVINNLVINAHQAMPDGGILDIRADNMTVGTKENLPLSKGDYIRIAIEDHGIGIPEKYRSNIFTPYFTTKQKGSGLGLATTYSIIRNHEGYITFESELGTGTTFVIYLPATRKKLSEESNVETAPVISTVHWKILIMDDEEVILELLRRMLDDIHYQVELTRNGSEAIARYRDAKESGKPFDAVILDLTVPGGMGGKEVIKQLIAIDPEVKAIVSSGYATDPVMAEFEHYGFSGVVTKPYDVKQMLKMLDSILQNN